MVERLRDKDGDIWERQPGGQWVLDQSPDNPLAPLDWAYSEHELRRMYGPLTPVEGTDV